MCGKDRIVRFVFHDANDGNDNQSVWVYADEETGEVCLKRGEIKLDYSDIHSVSYKYPTEEFLDMQIQAHEEFKRFLAESRKYLIEEAVLKNRRMGDLRRCFELDYSGLLPTYVRFIGIFFDIINLLKVRKSFRHELVSDVEFYISEVNDFELCRNIIDYGRELMGEAIQSNEKLQEKVRQKYEELIGLCRDISFMYTDIISRIETRIDNIKQYYQWLYGKPPA